MDIETAKAMLQLLLGKHWALFGQFNNFLEHSKYKVINKDQWCNILEFSRTIANDLSNYDVDGACKCFHINLYILETRTGLSSSWQNDHGLNIKLSLS